MSDDDEEAPGWDAIDAVFERLYPGQEPEHWGTMFPARVVFGGPEAIDGFSAYRATEPVPHWHWITYGLTELYAKESEDEEWSGWGYELTMRVPGEGDPPAWARTVLQKLANWAHAEQRVLRAGDWFDVGGPLFADDPCTLTGYAFVADDALPGLDSPNGRVEFVSVLGLHPDELAYIREHGLDAMLATAARPFAGDFNVLTRESFL